MKYDAFISYRHAELDTKIAKAVHKRLETFKVPGSVKKKSGKKKISRVFRDQDELPIGSDLTNNIELALSESEYLIVICTPRTPGSEWVLKEITTFIRLHDRSHVLAVLAEGEPNESFPAPLLVDENGNSVEPLAADVRGKNHKEIRTLMKTEIMRLAAPLLNCSYDDLRQRHRERKLKKTLGIVTGLGVVIAGLGVAFGFYNANKTRQINENYQRMLENQSKYLASTSLEILETGDRRTAALIALEALPSEEKDRPFVANAQYALSQALNCYNTGDSFQIDALLQMDYRASGKPWIDSEGKYIVAHDSSSTVYVWNAATYELITKINSTAKDNSLFIDTVDLAAVYNETLYVFRTYSIAAYSLNGDLLWEDKAPDQESFSTQCVNSDGTTFVAGGTQNLYVIDAASGSIKNTISNASSKMLFNAAFTSDDTKVIAKNNASSTLTIFDLTSNTSVAYETPIDNIVQFTQLDSKYIFVLGNDSKDTYSENSHYFVCAISLSSNELIWTKSLDVKPHILYSSTPTIKAHSYADANNALIEETVICIYDRIYSFNAQTGELKSSTHTSGDVAAIMLSTTSNVGLLCSRSGSLYLFDTNNCDVQYATPLISNACSIHEMAAAKGIYLATSMIDSTVSVIRTSPGASREEIITYDDKISSIMVSPSESNYLVKSNDTYRFYDAKTDELIYEYENDVISINEEFYLSDTEFCILSNSSELITIDLKEKAFQRNVLFKEYISKLSLSDNHKFCLVSTSKKTHHVYDVTTQQEVYSFEDNFDISFGNTQAVSSNGDTVAFFDFVNQSLVIFEKGKEKNSIPVLDAADGLSLNLQSLSFSNTDNYLSLHRSDGKLLIYELNNNEFIFSEYVGEAASSFYGFSPDDSTLVVQGNDYYYRVYDFDRKEYVYVSPTQYDTFKAITWNEDDTISVKCSNALLQLTKDYEPLMYAIKCNAYLLKENKLLSTGNRSQTLYSFKYYDLKALKEEVKRQFPNDRLSAYERQKYNID